MKLRITREELEAYRARWQLAEQIDRAEARQASLSTRWYELNAIFELVYEFGWVKPYEDDQVAQVRERRARLKANYP